MIEGISGTGSNGVLLVDEAFGAVEAKRGKPFQGPAGALLARMLAQGGWQRDEFLITNVCWHQPPGNRVPTSAEIEADRPRWEAAIRDDRIKVIVPLGDTALRTILSLDHIIERRGYQEWSERYHKWSVPTLHPAFLLRGNPHWTEVWIQDIKRALTIARNGPFGAPRRRLILDPPPSQLVYEQQQWALADRPPLAFDIETPGKRAAEKAEEAGRLGPEPIIRVGLAYRDERGQTVAISVPFGATYHTQVVEWLNAGRLLVVWNRHFDVPRLRQHGAQLPLSQVHDAQEMWHVYQPKLFKKLGQVAACLLPGQTFWKGLIREQLAYYNAVDAAVTLELFQQLWA